MKLDTNNKKRKKVHLLSTSAIASLIGVTVAAIYFLTPTSVSLEEKIASTQSPDVSLAYLKELEKTHPNDPMIPYLKAKIYYEKGNYNEVMRLLAPQIVDDPKGRSIDTYILFLKNKVALAGSIDNQDDVKTIEQIKSELDVFIHRDFSNEQLFEITDLCLAISDPKRAYQYLKKVENPSQKTKERLFNLALQNGLYEDAVFYKRQECLNNETLDNYKELFNLYLQASSPELYKNFIDTYKGSLRENPEFIKAQIDTANRLGLYDDSLDLLEKLCVIDSSEENLELLATACVSQGKLDKAALILQRIVSQNKSYEVVRRLHDIFMWQGDIENSQATSLMLLDLNPTYEDLTRGISESRSLADLENMSVFYHKMVEQDLVSPDLYNDCIDTIEKNDGTNKTIEVVLGLIKLDPKSDVLLGHKLRLYSYLNDYKTVGQTYFEIAKLRPVLPNEALYAADAFIMIGEDKQALKALTTVKNWQELDDNFVQEVATLAWTCDDRNLSLVAQNILLDRTSVVANSYFLVNSIGPVNKENLDKLIKFYEVNNDENVMLELLSYASTNSDYELLEKLIDLTKDKPLYVSDALLPYRANILMRQRDYVEANKIYTMMLKRNPHNIEAIDGLANIALITDDLPRARKLYKQYSSLFESNPNAWLVAANLADTLGFKIDSKYWFEKYLSNVKNLELSVLLSYASLVEESGYVDKAYKIRQYIAKQKTKELMELPDDEITLSSVVATLLSQDKARAVIERKLKDKQTDSLASIYIATLLDANEVKGVLYKRARTALSKATLTDTQEIVLAVRAKDKKKIEALLQKGVGISDANRYEALSRINRRLEAYRLATSTIGTHNKADDVVLRDRAAADSVNYSRSLQTLFTTVTKWGVRRYEEIYHAPYKLGQYTLNTSYQTSHAPSVLYTSKVEAEKRLQASVSLEKEKYTLIGSVDLADGAGNDRYGVKGELLYNLTERYSLGFAVGLNQHSTLSNMMMLLGKDNYAEASLSANPLGSVNISLTTRAHEYKTRFGENIGHGVDFEGTASYPLFLHDPSVNLYMSGVIQNNVLSDMDLNKSNAYNGTSLGSPFITDIRANQAASYTGDTAPPDTTAMDNYLNVLQNNYLNSASYISQKYRHLGFGVSIAHGMPQVPGPNVPSIRYVFDVMVGYNFGEQKVDSGIAMGVGTSLFNAQDELSLRTSFQTVDRQGDRAFNITLGYYSIF